MAFSRRTQAGIGAGVGLALVLAGEAALAIAGPNQPQPSRERPSSVTYQSALGACSIRSAVVLANGAVDVAVDTIANTSYWDYVARDYGTVPDRAIVFAGKNTVDQEIAEQTGFGNDNDQGKLIYRAVLHGVGPAGAAGNWDVSISNVDADPVDVNFPYPRGVGPDETISCGSLTVADTMYQPTGNK